MGHAVLTVERVDDVLPFYRDVLGFRLSDYALRPFRAFFLHINPRHHSLAMIETGRNGLHHLMVELFSLDDVGQGYDIAQTVPERVGVTLGRHTNDFMTSFYARSPADFMVEYGWGGRDIEPATWQPFECVDGPSLWGHERNWLPPEKRDEARALRMDAAARGAREPVQVLPGNPRPPGGRLPVVGRRDGRPRMSSLRRMLAVLDLFGPERPVWKAEEGGGVARGAAPPLRTATWRSCAGPGCWPEWGGDHTLGARVIELDYTIRASDPLNRAAVPVMRELRDRTGCDVLLADMIGDRILASHHERGNDSATVGFGRGRPHAAFPRRRVQGDPGGVAHRAAAPPPRTPRGRSGGGWHGKRLARLPCRRGRRAPPPAMQSRWASLSRRTWAWARRCCRGDGAAPGALVLVLSRARWGIANKDMVAAMVRTAAARVGAAASDLDGRLLSLPDPFAGAGVKGGAM